MAVFSCKASEYSLNMRLYSIAHTISITIMRKVNLAAGNSFCMEKSRGLTVNTFQIAEDRSERRRCQKADTIHLVPAFAFPYVVILCLYVRRVGSDQDIPYAPDSAYEAVVGIEFIAQVFDVHGDAGRSMFLFAPYSSCDVVSGDDLANMIG